MAWQPFCAPEGISRCPETARSHWKRSVPENLRRYVALLFVVVVTSQSGCAYLGNWKRNGFKVGPEYCKPAAPVADEWIDGYDDRVREDLPNYADWWTVFDDSTMSLMIDDMYQQNLPLRVAGLRVLEARQLRAIAVGSIFPQSQTAFGDYTRSQVSRNAINAPFFPRNFNQWRTGFDAFWEIDVWGKFRRNIEAANADLDATIEDYDAILVSLIAETAATYVDLRTAQERLRYAHANVGAQQTSLEIAESRFRNGATSELDVTQARTNLQNTKELIPTYENQVRLANNQLCVLLGTPPRDLTQEIGTATVPSAPADVAVGIPADLLRRRPDVRSAERQVAAQSARIGVAAADLLPHFSIRGDMFVQARTISKLFHQNSTAGNVSPGFSWDFLNYGRLLNNVRLQDTLFQQLAVQYQQTVLEANAEAENAIISFLKSQERLRITQEGVRAAERSVEIALEQYKQGATDFNRVANLQTVLTLQQDRLAETQGSVANSLIAINKALGGGWQIRYGNRGLERLPAAPERLEGEELDMLPPVPTDEPPEGESADDAT